MSLLALFLVAASAWARPPAADDAAGQAFTKALDRMAKVSQGMTEYATTFYKREWVDGALTPQEIVEVHYRRPWDIVMRWVGGNHMGRTLLYRGPDWNGGRFVVDPGPLLPVISLDPTSRMAMAGSRHSLYELPMPTVVEKFVRDARKVNDHPEWVPVVIDEGPQTVRGEPSHCYLSKLPKHEDATLYAREIRTCIHPTTGLPNSVRSWDDVGGTLTLVEEYDYTGFDLAPGFTDDDFDREKLGL